tara:strand:+ start:363 stop:698 length:336 start_codon:yes stop_codon:yes gene_type:complete
MSRNDIKLSKFISLGKPADIKALACLLNENVGYLTHAIENEKDIYEPEIQEVLCEYIETGTAIHAALIEMTQSWSVKNAFNKFSLLLASEAIFEKTKSFNEDVDEFKLVST